MAAAFLYIIYIYIYIYLYYIYFIQYITLVIYNILHCQLSTLYDVLSDSGDILLHAFQPEFLYNISDNKDKSWKCLLSTAPILMALSIKCTIYCWIEMQEETGSMGMSCVIRYQ